MTKRLVFLSTLEDDSLNSNVVPQRALPLCHYISLNLMGIETLISADGPGDASLPSQAARQGNTEIVSPEAGSRKVRRYAWCEMQASKTWR